MKSARRGGRIAGSRVHQHTMALKFETGWRGGERRASVEGRPPLRKRAVMACATSHPMVILFRVFPADMRGRGPLAPRLPLQPGLPLSEGPWAARHPPGLKWRGALSSTWSLCLSRTLGISVSGRNPRVASRLEL